MQVLTRIRQRELTGRQAVVGSLIGVGLTAACAQVAIHVPWTPVPVTMQVFAVLCCGIMLGSKYGLLSQIEYLAAGLAGAPVFAGFTGGPAVLFGPTGGYLIGFAVAAFVVGQALELSDARTFKSACTATLLGAAVIHVLGVTWLSAFHLLPAPTFAWAMGSLPFIGVDVAKAVLAAGMCVGFSRR